jgi:hypothetical protein
MLTVLTLIAPDLKDVSKVCSHVVSHVYRDSKWVEIRDMQAFCQAILRHMDTAMQLDGAAADNLAGLLKTVVAQDLFTAMARIRRCQKNDWPTAVQLHAVA